MLQMRSCSRRCGFVAMKTSYSLPISAPASVVKRWRWDWDAAGKPGLPLRHILTPLLTSNNHANEPANRHHPRFCKLLFQVLRHPFPCPCQYIQNCYANNHKTNPRTLQRLRNKCATTYTPPTGASLFPRHQKYTYWKVNLLDSVSERVSRKSTYAVHYKGSHFHLLLKIKRHRPASQMKLCSHGSFGGAGYTDHSRCQPPISPQGSHAVLLPCLPGGPSHSLPKPHQHRTVDAALKQSNPTGQCLFLQSCPNC